MSKTIVIDSSPDTTATELARRLNSISGYREISLGEDHAVVAVGNQFLMRLIGVYIFSNYTAPVEVTVEKSDSLAHITMSPPRLMWKIGDKVEDFFERTFTQIQAHLK